jgi:hypothetical protein
MILVIDLRFLWTWSFSSNSLHQDFLNPLEGVVLPVLDQPAWQTVPSTGLGSSPGVAHSSFVVVGVIEHLVQSRSFVADVRFRHARSAADLLPGIYIEASTGKAPLR